MGSQDTWGPGRYHASLSTGTQVATLKTQKTEFKIANHDLERDSSDDHETDNRQSERELEKANKRLRGFC